MQVILLCRQGLLYHLTLQPALANDVTLKAKLDDTVYFGLEKQYNSINIPFYLYIISLDYVYNFGWKNAEPFDGTLTSVVTPPNQELVID